MKLLNASTHKNILMPLPPSVSSENEDGAVHERFINHLRQVPNSRFEIKILSAIQFTADMLGHSDAHIAKILVDQGLRAPRMAFPVDFLTYADNALMRLGWQVGGPTESLLQLKSWWDNSAQDRFAAFRRTPVMVGEKIAY